MSTGDMIAIFLGIALLLLLALALMNAAGRSSEQERRWEIEQWRRDVEARLRRQDEEDDGK